MATKNGTIQAENKDGDQFTSQIIEVIHVFGGLLFIPVILLIGIGYGIRAGVIAGADKALSMYKSWGE